MRGITKVLALVVGMAMALSSGLAKAQPGESATPSAPARPPASATPGPNRDLQPNASPDGQLEDDPRGISPACPFNDDEPPRLLIG